MLLIDLNLRTWYRGEVRTIKNDMLGGQTFWNKYGRVKRKVSDERVNDISADGFFFVQWWRWLDLSRNTWMMLTWSANFHFNQSQLFVTRAIKQNHKWIHSLILFFQTFIDQCRVGFLLQLWTPLTSLLPTIINTDQDFRWVSALLDQLLNTSLTTNQRLFNVSLTGTWANL